MRVPEGRIQNVQGETSKWVKLLEVFKVELVVLRDGGKARESVHEFI